MAKDSVANAPKNALSDDDEQVTAMQVVAFKLKDEEYGVNIFQVQDINGMSDITRVPFAASFIKGVINQRGSVLPVIDLKKRLGIEETPYTNTARIVTVIVGDLQVGMLVDSVTEVLTIRTKLVDPKKTVNDRAMEKFLSGIGNIEGRLVTMLNLEEIVALN
ncbi:MAG: chemotaxis protein CheW [Selenomonadaceae bacterium]|nr:chemotaxis protein CheW [Selenomonadaceae bacterium]